MENTRDNETYEKHTICSKSGARIIMIGSNADEIIQELFDFLLNRYKTSLEQCMKGSNFIFRYISDMYDMCHKISINRDEST